MLKYIEKLKRFVDSDDKTLLLVSKFIVQPHRLMVGVLRPICDPIARWRLRRAQVESYILDFQSKRSANAIGPHWVDLYYLYRDIRVRKPKHVVEYGSGVSTCVIAAALRQNALEDGVSASFISIDAVPFWGQGTLQALPADLRDVVRIEVSEPQVETLGNGVKSLRHPTVVPFDDIDFVYVDGPPRSGDVVRSHDILVLEPKLSGSARVVFDGRTETTLTFRALRMRKYRDAFRALWSNDFVSTTA